MSHKHNMFALMAIFNGYAKLQVELQSRYSAI